MRVLLKKAKTIIWTFHSGKRSIIGNKYYHKYVYSKVNLPSIFCLKVSTNTLEIKRYNFYETIIKHNVNYQNNPAVFSIFNTIQYISDNGLFCSKSVQVQSLVQDFF